MSVLSVDWEMNLMILSEVLSHLILQLNIFRLLDEVCYKSIKVSYRFLPSKKPLLTIWYIFDLSYENITHWLIDNAVTLYPRSADSRSLHRLLPVTGLRQKCLVKFLVKG